MLYDDLLKEVLPLYRSGRSGDEKHILWELENTPKYADEKIDLHILKLVIILHDIGYHRVAGHDNPWSLDVRKVHMEEGAKLARVILERHDVDKDTIEQVCSRIAIHDNWVFGENFNDDPIMHLFNNFEILWMIDKPGFDIVRGFKNQSPVEYISVIEKAVNEAEEQNRDWYSPEVKELYEALFTARKAEVYGQPL